MLLSFFVIPISAYKDKRADSLIPEEYLSQRPKKGVEEDDAGGPMTPPTSPPHDTFSATEGEGEAVFAGKPISRSSPRKSFSRNEENQDEKQEKRQKLSPEKHSGQRLSPAAVESKAPELQRGSPQSSRKKSEKPKDERQPAPPQPPPPPRRRPSLLGTPPPPPPKGPPSRKRPPPPRRPSGIPTKRPPPPPNQNSSPKPPPPRKMPAPPPPSKPSHPAKQHPTVSEASSFDSHETPDVTPRQQQHQEQQVVHQIKRPPTISEAGLDLQTPDVKPNVNLPPGWMCVWSKSQKRWYFFNTQNNKSVWQWPPP